MSKKQRVLDDLKARNCLKVIAGITNYDQDRVLQIVQCAERMGASCVDVCGQESIVKTAVANTVDTAVVVSSVDPIELKIAQDLGANILELGNFEALYEQGIYYSADQVYALAEIIIEFKKDALVSITVPGHLSVKQQTDLAIKLEELGVDILQTEGASLVEATSPSVLGHIEKAKLTLANTIEISKTVNKPYILTASGISPDTAKLAIAAGAHGIGVGKYINKLDTPIEMLSAIQSLQEALDGTIEAKLEENLLGWNSV